MLGFVYRLVAVALGLWLASVIVPGIAIRDFGTLFLAALLLGLVNAFVRPLLILVTLPLTLVTLGLFILVINAAMIGLVGALLHGFQVNGFWAAFWCAIVVGLVSWLASGFIGNRGRIERIVRRAR